jgi:hypothetical protein
LDRKRDGCRHSDLPGPHRDHAGDASPGVRGLTVCFFRRPRDRAAGLKELAALNINANTGRQRAPTGASGCDGEPGGPGRTGRPACYRSA